MSKRISPSCSPGPCAGFTLVELLVVMAIVSLLIALLIPSLEAARQVARTATCLSQQHHIGVGFNAYAVDNLEYVPPVRLTSTTINLNYGNIAFEDLLCGYLGSDMTAADKNKQSFNSTTIKPYAGVAALFNCPSDPTVNTVGYIRTSYSLNSWQELRRDGKTQCSLAWSVQTSASSWEGRSRRISAIRSPAKLIAISEKAHPAAFCFGYSYGNIYTPALQGEAPNNGNVSQSSRVTNHGGEASSPGEARWNYLFMDAHAATMNPYQTVTNPAHATNNPTTNQDTSGLWTEDPND